MSANVAVLSRVREIIRRQPDRHYQGWWLTGAFDKSGHTHAFSSLFREPREADGLADWAFRDVPDRPLGLGSGDESPEEAVCGTRGCVGGWIALTTAPVGSLVDADSIYVPVDEARREGIDLGGMHLTWMRRGDRRLGERRRWVADRLRGRGAREYAYQNIEYWARDRAGLTESQTGYLFGASRSRAEVLDALDVLIEVDPNATGADLMSHFHRHHTLASGGRG